MGKLNYTHNSGQKDLHTPKIGQCMYRSSTFMDRRSFLIPLYNGHLNFAQGILRLKESHHERKQESVNRRTDGGIEPDPIRVIGYADAALTYYGV